MATQDALLIRTEAWWAVKKVQSETCVFFRDRAKAIKFGLALAAQWGGRLIIQNDDKLVPAIG